MLAQSLDRTSFASNSEVDTKADAARGDRAVDGAATAGAIMQAAVHRPVDSPADIASDPGDPSFFSRWLLSAVAGNDTPAGIEDAWQARRAAVVATIHALAPEKRAELGDGLNSLLRTMAAYAFDRGHIQQAFTDCQQTLARYEKKGGLYARSAWEADQDLAERMKDLGLDRNGLVLANDLWVTGGYPLLHAALRVGDELRSELAPEAPTADRAADAAVR